MLTQNQVEPLAQKAIQDFVNSCGCQTPEDVANVLMKLVSMCGLGMCATVGHRDAVARLQGTTDYIAKTQAGKSWRMEKAN